jgi:hypothetical protein
VPPSLFQRLRPERPRIDNALAALGLRTFDEIAAIIPNGPQIAAGRDLVKKHGILTERRERAAARNSLLAGKIQLEHVHVGGQGIKASTRGEGGP